MADTFRSAASHMISMSSGKTRFNVDLGLTAWANVNRAGSSNSPHFHPDNHWSGVFYIQTADFSSDPVARAGNIEFRDPRGPISMLSTPGHPDTSMLSVKPKQGTIILFPSWLTHSVNTFSIDTLRISLAFNVRIKAFQSMDK